MSALFVLSMMMFDGTDEDEIMRLTVTSVPSLSPCRVAGAYRLRDGELQPVAPAPQLTPALTQQVAALGCDAGEVTVPEFGWSLALPLRGPDGCHGYVVVGASSTPSYDESFLLKVLAKQTGAALTNAASVRRERANTHELGLLNDQIASVNDELSATASTLHQQTRIHQVLTEVAASGASEEGIASTLHDLVGLPVIVEDRFGNLRAWAGPGRPVAHRKASQLDRDDLLARAARAGRPIRESDRLVALAQPRSEVLAVISLVDPRRTAGRQETFALEHAATVLALQLAHRRGMAEVELRLRRDLVDDLVTGTDELSAVSRAESLRHDMLGQHQVVVLKWSTELSDDLVARAVERAASNLDMRALVARRTGRVVLVVPGEADAAQLHVELTRLLRTDKGAIGVGRPAGRPGELPRSYKEAVRALQSREASRNPIGVTVFGDLGAYRILTGGEDNHEVERFVRAWLGGLLDYDSERNSNLVGTLYRYFECGGNYDATAEALLIHRSTLRYRLQRIREVTGYDLSDVDSRLNLHVATRAWKNLNAP